MHLLSASCVCVLLVSALLRRGKPGGGGGGGVNRAAVVLLQPQPQVASSRGAAGGWWCRTQVPPKLPPGIIELIYEEELSSHAGGFLVLELVRSSNSVLVQVSRALLVGSAHCARARCPTPLLLNTQNHALIRPHITRSRSFFCAYVHFSKSKNMS